MRSIVIGAIVAGAFSLVSAVPTVSAPANVAVIGQAAADMGSVTQALVHVARLARLLPSLALRVREFPISI